MVHVFDIYKVLVIEKFHAIFLGKQNNCPPKDLRQQYIIVSHWVMAFIAFYEKILI